MSYDLNCPLCNPHQDIEQQIVLESKTCYFLQHNRHQDVLEGSGLIVPKKHRQDIFELTKEEWNDTYNMLHEAKKVLQETVSPDGYTIGWNVGKVSNQEIPHCHLHVIPRYHDEPLAGKGIRYWLKQENNRRENSPRNKNKKNNRGRRSGSYE
ncbi:HIT family protein [Jeotgalibacillus haloalkalitolerans]|uniref:HIT family protein n=1 Tax=Jeotgalibacillus haloalkalitolerans TaxID=3104292 RepID=A0ABU5KQH8_9BACL|nr:HIT family protein [Jeotgalibacillus sp. HH7-29]MDZ5713201.1 HIT family protein [Jeotgalibacillus sp. HH7-29]